MPKNITNQSGFSLFEIMIVLTIITILTMMAIPSYRHYVAKARFAELTQATQLFKTAVTVALQQGYPLAELENGMHDIPLIPASTKNIDSIKVKQGIITATASALLQKNTYVLTPNEDGSHYSISGSCLAAGLCND